MPKPPPDYVNAGAPAPHRDCAPVSLISGGTIIGMLTNATYEQESLQLANGDLLVASTDGLCDAPTPDDEEFGEERLQALLIASAGLPAEQVKSALGILNSNARRTA